jgi:iron complex transport system ATP-binding protein
LQKRFTRTFSNKGKIPGSESVLLQGNLMQGSEAIIIEQSQLKRSENFIVLESPILLKTMSSGVVGSGTGWYSTFVNRHVNKDYDCSDHRQEMVDYLRHHGFDPSQTVGMMTAVMLEDVCFQFFEEEGFSVFIVVTAGVGNAVDASRSWQHSYEQSPGTINTWVFVNGELTEEAFIQSIMTATEVKTKAMHDLEIRDRLTGSIATGTSTDSVLIAATQQGERLEYAGTITELGRVIGKGVYECTINAIKNSRKRVSK